MWGFFLFFNLLCGYYILRPVRDEMGIAGGVGQLQWMFTATFVLTLLVVPLFGWAARKIPRRKLVPAAYFFVLVNLFVFYFLFTTGVSPVWTARAFFVWVSVYNLFVISLFWSLLNDIFSDEEARRKFPLIAAGGSLGAIVGPALSAFLSQVMKPSGLIPLSALFLGLGIFCVYRLLPHQKAEKQNNDTIGGGIFSGAVRLFRSPYLLGISLFILLYTTLSTFLYFQQAHIIKDAFSNPSERTTVFAVMDFAVNGLTILSQLLVTSRLVIRWGLPFTLALVPILLTLGFVALSIFPVLATILVIQVLRRAGNYAITRPAREMLFTVIEPEDKYKTKNFIDTVIYRGGDALSGWAFKGFLAVGIPMTVIPLVGAGLSAVWAVTGLRLGARHEERAAESPPGGRDSENE